MDLVQVNVVRAQVPAANSNIRFHRLFGTGHTLGCYHKPVTDTVQSIAYVLLTDGVTTGCINIIHTLLHQETKQGFCFLCTGLLNGNTTETHPGDL